MLTLSGHRAADAPLLTAHVLPGELVALPIADPPALLAPVTADVPEPGRLDARLAVVRGAGFVRYSEIDWVHRRARLEVALTVPGADAATIKTVVELAVTHAFTTLDLRRLHGRLTPALGAPVADGLAACGFVVEGTVPGAVWLDGRAVDGVLLAVLR